MQEIPAIDFNSKMPDIDGFEIISLERIIHLNETTNHDSNKPHRLKFYMLAFYTQGESKQQVDFEWYTVKKNSLIYLSKGQVNAFEFSKDSKGYCILFTSNYFEKCFGNLSKQLISRLFSPHLYSPLLNVPTNSDLQQYIELLFAEFYHEQVHNKELIVSSIFTIVMTKLEQLLQLKSKYISDNNKLNTFSKFVQLLDQQYTRNRNADFYAFSIGVSYKHLNTICKELVNKTAKKFIDDHIILEAKRQLINSTLKSTELAYSLGFEEPTNFVKYFKKHTGSTPNSFKKQVSKG